MSTSELPPFKEDGKNKVTLVIGKLIHLKEFDLPPYHETLVKELFNQPSEEENWKLNEKALLERIRTIDQILDVSVDSQKNLICNTGFLKREREVLLSQGWYFDNGYWYKR